MANIHDSQSQNGLLENLNLSSLYKQEDIKVSIIIPFYNRLNWVFEAILSAQIQSHKNIQIIAINDGSTENTDEIKNSFSTDKRILFIDQPKLGVSAARNSGIRESCGKYITFLDSDDIFYKKKIEYQLNFMEKRNLVISHTSYELMDSNKNHLFNMKSGNQDYLFPEIIRSCQIATPTVMVNRNFLLKNNLFFNEYLNIGEDICFWIRISQITIIYGIDKTLTKVRKHNSNAAYNREKQITGIENILGFVKNNYNIKDISKQVSSLHYELFYLYNSISHADNLINDKKNQEIYQLLKRLWQVKSIRLISLKVFLPAIKLLFKIYNKIKTIF